MKLQWTRSVIDKFAQRNFDSISRAFRDIEEIGTGIAVATFTAAHLSAVVTVPHGMDRAPTKIFCQILNPLANATTRGFTVEVDDATITKTQFQARVWCSNATPTGDFDFFWVAIA